VEEKTTTTIIKGSQEPSTFLQEATERARRARAVEVSNQNGSFPIKTIPAGVSSAKATNLFRIHHTRVLPLHTSHVRTALRLHKARHEHQWSYNKAN
jgi:hypothetical protein